MNLHLPSTNGIELVEPAVLFAVLYAVLALVYIWKTSRNPAHAFTMLVIFCIFRVVGFILRAILAASDGAKENGGIVIAETIFFSLGFVGLLYSVFILILNREAATRQVLGDDEDQPSNPILGLILSRRLTDLTFTAAAAVGIASAAYIVSDWGQSERLRKVTIALYLYITICLAIHATILVYKEKEALRLGLRQRTTVCRTYAVFLYCPILFLLLIRQAYLIATFSSFNDRQNNERLWYPLFVLPEFLAACLFVTPGLVPHPEELPTEEKEQSYWSRLWRAYNTSA